MAKNDDSEKMMTYTDREIHSENKPCKQNFGDIATFSLENEFDPYKINLGQSINLTKINNLSQNLPQNISKNNDEIDKSDETNQNDFAQDEFIDEFIDKFILDTKLNFQNLPKTRSKNKTTSPISICNFNDKFSYFNKQTKNLPEDKKLDQNFGNISILDLKKDILSSSLYIPSALCDDNFIPGKLILEDEYPYFNNKKEKIISEEKKNLENKNTYFCTKTANNREKSTDFLLLKNEKNEERVKSVQYIAPNNVNHYQTYKKDPSTETIKGFNIK